MRQQRRRKRKNSRRPVKAESYYVDEMAKDQISFWSLSILLDLNGHRDFVDKDGNLAYFLNLNDYAEDTVNKTLIL